MIEAVLFDYDGTIADTSELIINSFQSVYIMFQGKERDIEYIRDCFGEPLKTTIEREFTEPFEVVVKEYRNYQANNFNNYVKLFDNTEKALDYLKKKGLKLGVVTSRTKESVIEGLKELKIYDYFDIIIAIEDTVNHKPHREPLDKAMQLLQVDCTNTLYVGDSRFDMECANNAGVKVALAGWHNDSKKITEKYHVDYVLDNLYDIVKLIQ